MSRLIQQRQAEVGEVDQFDIELGSFVYPFRDDGGLVSNTPLQWVLECDERQDTLAFQVDVWSARGSVPRTLGEMATRHKEIQYSSRTRASSDRFRKEQKLRSAFADLFSKLPEELKATAEFALLNPEAGRKVYNVIQLIYRSKSHESESKDFEFSRRSMEDHWVSGQRHGPHPPPSGSFGAAQQR